MSERPKEHDWKSCIDVSLSRVRIPLSPPYVLNVLQHIIILILIMAHREGFEPSIVRSDSGARKRVCKYLNFSKKSSSLSLRHMFLMFRSI